jgi:hypothetical protein
MLGAVYPNNRLRHSLLSITSRKMWLGPIAIEACTSVVYLWLDGRRLSMEVAVC